MMRGDLNNVQLRRRPPYWTASKLDKFKSPS